MEIDENEIIIQIVSDYKCIYDKSSESYKDNVFKKNAWLQIADRVNKITEIPIDGKFCSNVLIFQFTSNVLKLLYFIFFNSALWKLRFVKKFCRYLKKSF